MTKRILYSIVVIMITLLSFGVRVYAAQRLAVDYDEPVYLGAAVEYAKYIRAGDYKMLAWSENTYEHPALYKILYGVVLLTQTPLEKLPDNDLPRLAPIDTTEAGDWNIAGRYLSVFWGTMAVLILTLANPLAGLFLGVSTLSVKYTSEVYLEALPLLASLLSALAYMNWFNKVRKDASAPQRHMLPLILSAAFLGITAASKYVYSIVGLAIFIHFILAVYQKQIPVRLFFYLAIWGILSVAVFFIFDPYLWPHPISRLMKTIIFHEQFQNSRLVNQYSYPFWQPLRWLSAFSVYYDLRPPSAFVFNIDTFIFVLAVIGLPRLYQKQRLFFNWLVVGLAFLLVWTTKWPQYTLIILAPFSMAAAEGCVSIWRLIQRSFQTRSSPTIKP